MRHVATAFLTIKLLFITATHFGKDSENVNRIHVQFEDCSNDEVEFISYNIEKIINKFDKYLTEDKKQWSVSMLPIVLLQTEQCLPSIVLAQAILETGYGQSSIGNNIFGIKGKGSLVATHEFIDGKRVDIIDEFQDFASVSDAIKRHASIVEKHFTNDISYADLARKIHSSGYATDPKYASKLIFLIEQYELYRLDSIMKLCVSDTNLLAMM